MCGLQAGDDIKLQSLKPQAPSPQRTTRAAERNKGLDLLGLDDHQTEKWEQVRNKGVGAMAGQKNNSPPANAAAGFCGILCPDAWKGSDILILLKLFGEPETTAKRSKTRRKKMLCMCYWRDLPPDLPIFCPPPCSLRAFKSDMQLSACAFPNGTKIHRWR